MLPDFYFEHIYPLNKTDSAKSLEGRMREDLRLLPFESPLQLRLQGALFPALKDRALYARFNNRCRDLFLILSEIYSRV